MELAASPSTPSRLTNIPHASSRHHPPSFSPDFLLSSLAAHPWPTCVRQQHVCVGGYRAHGRVVHHRSALHGAHGPQQVAQRGAEGGEGGRGRAVLRLKGKDPKSRKETIREDETYKQTVGSALLYI